MRRIAAATATPMSRVAAAILTPIGTLPRLDDPFATGMVENGDRGERAAFGRFDGGLPGGAREHVRRDLDGRGNHQGAA